MTDISSSGFQLRRFAGRTAARAETVRNVPDANGKIPGPGKCLTRRVQPELLDLLPADDPRAVRSRRELRRVNRLMGHDGILAHALRQALSQQHSHRIAEIGAGDGESLIRVARRLRGQWPRVDAALIDQQDLLKPETRARFLELNWHVRSVKDDVFRWLQQTESRGEAMTANLFLHHFHDAQLRELLARAAERTRTFVALEPRRARWPLLFSRLLPLIGCGPVTCHDAPVSVRAGFIGRELSALWPDKENWRLTEHSAGRFSHLFIARKTERTTLHASPAGEFRDGAGAVAL